MDALSGISWTSIDILRVGLERQEPPSTEEHPVTLLISVEKDSTPWVHGHEAVMRCVRILERHSIFDVACEMKEGQVTRLARPQLAPQAAPKLEDGSPTIPFEFQSLVTEHLGHSIATVDNPGREGTKALYLRDGKTNQVFALACRHVVFDVDSIPNSDYTHADSNMAFPISIIQPGDQTQRKMIEDLHGRIKEAKSNIQSVNEFQRISDKDKAHRITTFTADQSAHEKARNIAEQLKDPESRIIGHVKFSPRMETAAHGTGASRLRDWALIELHPGKHSSAMSDLRNRVSVPPFSMAKLNTVATKEFGTEQPDLIPNGVTNSIGLNGTISVAEMKKPSREVLSLDAPVIVVAKYGRTTGFTIGLANNLVSLTREAIAGMRLCSEEWCIVGLRNGGDGRREPFSSGGDSGAAIWDNNGRVGAIVTAANDGLTGGAYDVTYATPIEWLLNDIRGYGYNVELVRGDVE